MTVKSALQSIAATTKKRPKVVHVSAEMTYRNDRHAANVRKREGERQERRERLTKLPGEGRMQQRGSGREENGYRKGGACGETVGGEAAVITVDGGSEA